MGRRRHQNYAYSVGYSPLLSIQFLREFFSRRCLRARRAKLHGGSREIERDFVSREGSVLRTRIFEWRSQAPPGLLVTGDEPLLDFEELDRKPEDEAIVLPSSIEVSRRPASLAEIERKLREGQANDALATIRKCLSHEVALLRNKSRNVRGQRANTRANEIISNVKAQVNAAAEEYREAYGAMVSLGMTPDDHQYRHLNESDLRVGRRFDPDEQRKSKKKLPLPWIWHNTGSATSIGSDWLEEGNLINLIEYAAILTFHS
jgi:hypothetical protein